MIDGVCSCCGYLARCVEFIGLRSILICLECGQRAAARNAFDELPAAGERGELPGPKRAARETRSAAAPARPKTRRAAG